ncbi:hypothetical protein [Janthinobacterium sp. RB2R34]|uniref:hypothetical protein n=1 Tax=Janthinobacterium sp. RB2R34 TaxID=3424193 RepID=UPI003F21285B
MSIDARLKKLAAKASSKGEHALAAAAFYLMQDLDAIDRQINLVGALHEVGYLQNSLKPYWQAFRMDEAAWIERCLARLLVADHDYWALAALLGCNGPATISMAAGKGFKSAATRLYQRFDQPDVQVDTLYLNAIGKVLHPILEIGHDTRDMQNVDLGRARALTLDHAPWQPGDPLGSVGLSLSMQARLPHGAWRSVWAPFATQQTSELT